MKQVSNRDDRRAEIDDQAAQRFIQLVRAFANHARPSAFCTTRRGSHSASRHLRRCDEARVRKLLINVAAVALARRIRGGNVSSPCSANSCFKRFGWAGKSAQSPADALTPINLPIAT